MTRNERRLRRQFAALERKFPAVRGVVRALVRGRWRLVRLPLALLLIAGGLVSFLPILGVWMLPIGLLLLALDVPAVQPLVSALIIRARRRYDTLRRWWMDRRRRN